MPLTDEEVAQLDDDDESPLSEDDEPTSIVPLPNESQELYESTPANGAADASLYWVPRVRPPPPSLAPSRPVRSDATPFLTPTAFSIGQPRRPGEILV